MKKILLSVFTAILILSSASVSFGIDPGAESRIKDSTFNPSNLLSVQDAEKILGESAILMDNSSSYENGAAVYKSSFVALKEDVKTKKTGIVYFMFETYNNIDAARDVYSTIKRSNEDHEGVKILNTIGDEAYYHSSENFYFVLVRKAEKMFRLKVNKTTSLTSESEFMRITERIAASM